MRVVVIVLPFGPVRVVFCSAKAEPLKLRTAKPIERERLRIDFCMIVSLLSELFVFDGERILDELLLLFGENEFDFRSN